MPQLDLTSYNSQLFWSIFLFLYLYLYIHTNVIVIITQILKTRNIKNKIDINYLNNLSLDKEINQLTINFFSIFKLLRFLNFSNLISINIFSKILEKNNYSSKFFFKSIFNYLIIK